MSYQVLARRWRPRNFAQMVGQQHALKPLINALDHDRLHHAFLFTGTRGVGKTTLARILAKSINCEEGVSSTPCGKCSSCQEIDEGRFIDLIEVDAASRTKVDDTRELLDNVQYVPTRGRYKVYLIDEVHMLSKHSFNALLKTLEEPPPHVKFIFATTDPQKLPATILSRCLQFNLKQLTAEEIQGHLAHILAEEQVPFHDDALWEIAHAAHGSMRDALSLLDQAISYGNGELKMAEVSEMLGTIDRTRIVQLLHHLIKGDGESMLEEIEQIGKLGGDYSNALNGVNHALQQIAIYQVIPETSHERFGEAEQLRAIAGQVDRESIQLYYQIGINGLRDLSLAPDLRSGFEMVMLRMLAFQPQASALQTPAKTSASRPIVETKPVETRVVETEIEPAAKSETKGHSSVQESTRASDAYAPEPKSPVNDISESQPPEATVDSIAAPQQHGYQPESFQPTAEQVQLSVAPEPEPEPDSGPEPVSDTMPISSVADEMLSELQTTSESSAIDQQWLGWVNTLPLTAMVRQLAENCVLINADNDSIRLHLIESCAHLRHEQREQVLADALSNFLERKIRVTIEVANTAQQSPAELKRKMAAAKQAEAEATIANDPLVHSMQEQFGARVVADSVKPR